MMIVDAQVYVWATYTPERPWPEDGLGREHGLVPMMSDALLTQMDEQGLIARYLCRHHGKAITMILR